MHCSSVFARLSIMSHMFFASSTSRPVLRRHQRRSLPGWWRPADPHSLRASGSLRRVCRVAERVSAPWCGRKYTGRDTLGNPTCAPFGADSHLRFSRFTVPWGILTGCGAILAGNFGWHEHLPAHMGTGRQPNRVHVRIASRSPLPHCGQEPTEVPVLSAKAPREFNRCLGEASTLNRGPRRSNLWARTDSTRSQVKMGTVR